MKNGWMEDFLARERLPDSYADTVATVAVPLAERIAGRTRSGGIVIGLCGPQASGKSTLTAVLAQLLEGQGLRTAVLSLDDLYLTRAERAVLGRRVHPLLATRGVPGTHDVALGMQVLGGLRGSGRTILPRFDKGADDRGEGSVFEEPADVGIFEGWCVGAIPQPAADLARPVNDLERECDSDGRWRVHVNDQLAGPYRGLFEGFDFLVLLQAPGFEAVLAWRQEQERKLRERLAREGAGGKRAMSDDEVAGFIAHYERLTRWILAEMPARADATVTLDGARGAALRA